MSLPRALRTASLVWLCLAGSLLATPVRAENQPAEEPAREAGKDVPAPKRTRFVAPQYPPDAQARGLRGIVILELIIDTKGKVASATVTRSVPPFDDAALSAARQWEYEVTHVGGKAVPVRLSVPITFTMPVPRATRQEGIPEVVQGVNPALPAGQDRPASVVAQVTLEPSGQVSEIEIQSGEPPFADAVLDALRTWRFAPGGDGATISFRVEADFVPGAKGTPPRVDLRLVGLRRSETAANASPSPEPEPSAASPAPPPPAQPAAAAASPEPSPAPVPAPRPALVPPAPGPPVEVLGPAPMPAPPPAQGAPGAAAPPPEVPVSGVRDVALSPGVPDLLRGRRPVVPPLARMSSVTGMVEVRFAVDAAGTASVQEVTGTDLLKEAARQTVASWVFRRTTADRLRLAATFVYGAVNANATVRREE